MKARPLRFAILRSGHRHETVVLTMVCYTTDPSEYMHRNLLVAVALSVMTGIGGYALSNYAGAQGTPSAQSDNGALPPQPPGRQVGDGGARRSDGWQSRWSMAGRGMPDRWRARRSGGWGLFSPQADKNLSATDVQTIAQAILLRHGNHTWKVINVVPNQDDTVSFMFATQNGDVIARFAMDIHTGHIRRLA
jgi:hypothetical protein